MTEAIERHDQQEAEAAEVIDFPRRQQQGLEFAELDMPAEVPQRSSVAGRVPPALRRAGSTAVRSGRAAAPHVTAGARFAARHGFYLAGGSWDVVTTTYKRWTLRDVDERIAAAQAAGEHGTAAQLMQQKIESKKLFIERIRVFGQVLRYSPHTIVGISVAGALATLITSIVAAIEPGGIGFAGVWGSVFDGLAVMASWGAWTATVGLPSLGFLLVTGLVASGYNRRRLAQDAPEWARPAVDGGDARELVPDEGAILQALRNLGIGSLNDAFKKGWGTADSPTKVFEEGTVRDGQGYRTQIRLPQGVDVDTINSKKKLLAHNLVRFPVEVWPTEPRDKPGVMDLWVADQGVLTGSVGPWPWLEGLDQVEADYFTGVPVGKDIRGDVIWANLFEANFAIAGIMGSGKSTLALEISAGAALDPLVDLDVFILAENADFEPLSPRLNTLLTGPGDEIVQAASDKLTELWDELEIRGQALKEHGERKNSRKLAEKDARLRPRVLVIDECQNLFLHKKLGEQAAVLTKKLINTARKYGITVLFLTPEASTSSLPRQVMAVISNKACFAIGDQQSNDAVLGTGSYKSGISATGLEPKTSEGPGDVGTAMTKGFKAKPSLLRTFYINETELAQVCEQAMSRREAAGISTETTTEAGAPAARDLLDDLDQVLGAESVPSADVPALLRDLAPGYAPYAGMTGTQLRTLLDQHGIKVPSTGNRYPLDPTRVRTALAQRATADLDEDDDAAS